MIVIPLLLPVYVMQIENIWELDSYPDFVYILVSGRVHYLLKNSDAIPEIKQEVEKIFASQMSEASNSKSNVFQLHRAKMQNAISRKIIPEDAPEPMKLVFKTMIAGSYFGEIDIILSRARQFDAHAGTGSPL